MGLKQKIQKDMKRALKEGNKQRLSILRLLLSEVKNKEIEKREELSKEELLQVISKQVKKGKEAAEEFEKVDQKERATQERAEIAILQEYLPLPLSPDELRNLVEEAIKETGASNIKGLGQVMKVVMSKVRGRANGKRVNALVREILLQQEKQERNPCAP